MTIHIRADGPCGTIVIQNPEHRNALTREMLANLRGALDDLYQQKSVRAVVLTGDGTSFSAGTDLRELYGNRDEEEIQQRWHLDAHLHRELVTQMLQFPKPIIAAINGPALGLGLGLVAACDLAIASPNATFGFPEVRRGLTAGVAIPLIAHRIGAARASHLLFRKNPIDAETALEVGLIQEIVSFDQVWARAYEWVEEIANASHIAISMTKRVLNETVGEALMSQLSAAAATTATARTTEHAMEGVNAFLEKRDPVWQ